MPALALRLIPAEPASLAAPQQVAPRLAAPSPGPALTRPSRPAQPAAPVSSVSLSEVEPVADDRVLTGKIVELDVSEEWIAEIAAGTN